MGCGPSKTHETKLVTLCRERRDLIRSAVNCRYALANAHSAYIGSLKTVGYSLHRFVSEGFVPVALPSPVLTLPEDSKKGSSSKNDSSSTSISHSVSQRSLSGSHLRFGSEESVSPLHSPRGVSGPSSPARESSALSSPSMLTHTKSMGIPTMVFGERMPWWPPEAMAWGEPDWRFAEPGVGPSTRPPPPPPSPPKPGFAWDDFFNPFGPVEEVYSYYGKRNSSISSPDSAEIRLKEGIPDLEDESQIDDGNEAKKGQKSGVDGSKGLSGDNASSSGHIMIDEDDEDDDDDSDDHIHSVSPEKSNKGPSSEASGSRSTTLSAHHKKGVSFGGEVTSAEDAESTSKTDDLVAVVTQGTRDISDVVKEINGDFGRASESCLEISKTLEVGKLPYRPRTTLIKAKMPLFSSSTASRMQPSTSEDPSGDLEIKVDGLSTILEKIYTWESKLFVEVKEEEKIRLGYEKKFKRLKDLNRKGAEPEKLQATQSSIKKELTKINITIRSIDAMSNKVHKLRDNQLQSELTKLIQGMIRMWKVMLACHQKQLQAISEGKILDVISRFSSSDCAMGATMQLERGASSWCSSLVNWMNAQRAYVKTLNDWLRKCIDEKPEVTADGVAPFSPGRVGAPPVFVICNDWYQLMKDVSESHVIEAVNAFVANIHKLWEQLDEEKRKSREIQYLSKDLDKRARLLQEESRIPNAQGLPEKLTISFTKEDETSLQYRRTELDAMKKRLEEEELKHAELVRQVQSGAFTILKIGLVKIFEAMVNFASSVIKGYEQIRIPTSGDA
ncbi:protein ALTERED PHOSPHATE STARVATION RESPONSE 1 [Nymphaea colorata]|nr:protein ALTERED PHOSPHATE STARVATION RESPONSE 1 [Nymphaea colorata]